MKTRKRLTLSVAFLVAVLAATTHAQTWETVALVDDNAVGNWPAISASPTGLLLATVTHLDAPGTYDYLPRLYASADHGVTWERIPDDSSGFHPDRIVFNKAGDAVAIGWGGQLAKSTNGGRNWTVASTPDFIPANYPGSDTITVDPSGRIWVVGFKAAGGWQVLSSSDGGTTWTPGGPMPEGNFRTIAASSTAVIVSGLNSAGWATWRSVDGGATWTQVDSFKLAAADLSGMTYAKSAAVDSRGRFYVVGQALPDPLIYNLRWIVRGSTNGGLSWTTLDNFFESNISGPQSYATAVTVTPQDSVYVIGYSLKNIAGTPWDAPPWRVRASSNGGRSWQTVDAGPPAADPTVAPAFALALDVTSDPSGNVFVIGNQAIVRRLPGPPRLSTSIQQGMLQLAWPTNIAGFTLQTATALSNGTSWQNSSLTPSVTDGQNVVTVNPTSPAAFFRLKKL
jgi:hypothetical protein